MQIIDNMINYLEVQSTSVPLELFVTIGAFIEEVITPIPSPVIMVLAGTLAQAQHQPIAYLLYLALFGAIGKTFGTWVLYALADKVGDFLISKFGKYIGVSNNDVENIGKKLTGGWKDFVFLFFARALPIIPSAPVSVACGIIKTNLKTYLSTAFLGTFVRNMMFLYLGYAGLGNYKDVTDGLSGVESVIQLFLFVAIVGVIGWAYYKRRKQMVPSENSN